MPNIEAGIVVEVTELGALEAEGCEFCAADCAAGKIAVVLTKKATTGIHRVRQFFAAIGSPRVFSFDYVRRVAVLGPWETEWMRAIVHEFAVRKEEKREIFCEKSVWNQEVHFWCNKVHTGM